MKCKGQIINKDNSKKQLILLTGFISIIIGGLLVILFSNEKIDIAILEENLKIINEECNSVYENIDEKEKKYKELFPIEKDYFKKGMYASALTQIYAIKGDANKIMEYSKLAEENYKNLEGGEYYIISEKKYIAWVLLKTGSYPQSFKVTSELLELINSNKYGILNKEEITDTQALIYSIFLYIYSHFEIMDKAEEYYNKLNQLPMTQDVKLAKGDRMAASKMMYAEKKGDFELMKKYAQECYDISYDKDVANKTQLADAMLSNIAFANIKLGDYKEALEQIKKSEIVYKRVDDAYGLIHNMSNYATYYEEIGDSETANEYYKKVLTAYSEKQNYYELERILKIYIEFLENHKVDENIERYYCGYYKLTKKIDEQTPIKEFMSQVIAINDDLNESTVLLLKEQSKQHENGIIVAILVIISLTALITRMKKLIKIKNESEKKLEHIANTDYLTGLNTRAYGEKLILREMRKGTKLSIGVIDIDHFKAINDTHGHIFGDFILKEVAKYIKDSLGEEAIITRFGGEEFTIAFIGKGKLEAKETLDRIREDINSIVFDNNARVSFSAGIKEWDETDLNILIKQADELLYRAKREGRNRVLI